MPNRNESIQVRWIKRLDDIKVWSEEDPEVGFYELVSLGKALAVRHGLDEIYSSNYVWSGLDLMDDRCDLTESILIVLSFIEQNKSEDGVGKYYRSIELIGRKLLRDRENRGSERTGWLMGILLESLYRNLDLIRAAGDGGRLAEAVETMIKYCPLIRNAAIPMTLDLMRAGNSKEKSKAMNIVLNGFSTIEAACLLSEYFTNLKDQDSFFIEPAIVTLGALTGRGEDWTEMCRLDEDGEEALRVCFESLDRAWPVVVVRGHEKFLLKALKSKIITYPKMKWYLSDELLKRVEKYEDVRESDDFEYDEGKYYGTELEFVDEFYYKLSETDQRRLDRLFQRGSHREIVDLLEQLFESTDSSEIDEDLFYLCEDMENVKICLEKNRVILELLRLMADDPKYRFQMGVLLSMMDFSDLPKRVRDRIRTEGADVDLDLMVSNEGWCLCSDAEPRMMDALYNGSTILVERYLLIKHKGKLSALCLKTFTTKRGYTFVEGNWYSPVDEKTRDFIKEAFERGETSMGFKNDSEWALMRSVDQNGNRSGEDYLREVRRVALKGEEVGRRIKFRLESD